ncbi:MAG TPA: hypothetical protein VKY33_08225 [Flavobacterium sp.]|nr:hypothetical protein [Flavobacterium sp.]
MKLTAEQIDVLFIFTKKHSVKHYDVQVELVDHLANAIEAQWKTNPNISFEKALQKEYKNFGVFGFSGLVEQKQTALQNHYWHIIKKEFINFFSVPKVIISVGLFYLLFQLYSNPTEMREQVWFALKCIFFVVTLFLWIYQSRQLKKVESKYLLHSINNYFISVPVTFIVFFSSGIDKGPNVFQLLLDTTTTTIYILFVVILFTKIIPLIKNEIRLTEQKFQKI